MKKKRSFLAYVLHINKFGFQMYGKIPHQMNCKCKSPEMLEIKSSLFYKCTSRLYVHTVLRGYLIKLDRVLSLFPFIYSCTLSGAK